MKRDYNILLHNIPNSTVLLTLLVLLSIISCKQEENKPLVSGEKPGELKNLTVTNLNGSSKITYSLPDKDAFYVLAEYESRPGVKRQVKSSIYKQEVVLEGFEKAGEYEVTLYVVGRDEQRSDKVSVKVAPLLPPYLQVFNSVAVNPDWGGINIHAENDDEKELAFGVFAVGEDGKPLKHTFYYTKQELVNFAVRGFESKKTTFGLYIRDRWENHSDTLFVELKPLFEAELDRTQFLQATLPTDTDIPHATLNSTMNKMWLDNITNRDQLFLTRPSYSPIPQWFTFDMRKAAKLSRMRIWHRATFFFDGGNLKRFEVYGSNDPNKDGSWESWTKIGDFNSRKPSGLPQGTLSNEDTVYMTAGEEFVFALNTPAFRYLRFKTLEVWGNVQYISIQKMQVWGEVSN